MTCVDAGEMALEIFRSDSLTVCGLPLCFFRETLNKSGWCYERPLWEAVAHVSEANGATLRNCRETPPLATKAHGLKGNAGTASGSVAPFRPPAVASTCATASHFHSAKRTKWIKSVVP